MTKKKIEDFEVEVKTKKVRVKAKKEAKKIDLIVDTPKVDVEIHTTGEEKEFKYDSEKLDIEVKKTEKGTEINVITENNLLKRLGNFIGKLVTRKFNKSEDKK
jgi:hypothetical protein